MKLTTLLRAIGLEADASHDLIDIRKLCTNSSTACEDSLFIAISGHENDGHDYIDEAVRLGAAAVIGEKEITGTRLPYHRVENSRIALAELARTFYGDPTKGKILIGITGTNGKTTTSFMIRHILEQNGLRCALFGSVYTIVNGKMSPAPPNTTPDALEFNRQLEGSQDDVIIMEVSSHGIAQHRVAGLLFDLCLFTNLDQDHLDYHKTMENYFSIKATLFDQVKDEGVAVIHCGDEWGENLAEIVRRKGKKTVRVGGVDPDYYVGQVEMKTAADSYLDHYRLQTKMIGKHNIENAGMAFAAMTELGLSKEAIEESLASFEHVPGRFELFSHPKKAVIVVDYAHTCHAFEHILQTAREMGARRIFHVFGFRGKRDMEKRKNMVEVSVRFSNGVILTFDDLNGEQPERMEEALRQLSNDEKVTVIPDRTLAIQSVWEQLNEGDWLIVTGKGHEHYKENFYHPATSDPETILLLQQEGCREKVVQNNSNQSKNNYFLEKC